MNALRRAIKIGDADAVATLLRSDPNVRLKQGWTPLHLAVKAGQKQIISFLLKEGADLNAQTEMRRTPVDIACEGHRDDIVKLLRNCGGRSASEVSLHAAALLGDLTWTKKHIKAGADINSGDNGELPVCLALQRGHWAIVTFLLKSKCNVTKPQKWGATPLHTAASAGADPTLLEKILKLGANIDAIDASGSTPLCYAAGAGHAEVAHWLIDRGANVAVGDEKGTTPVSQALSGDHFDLAKHLIDRGALSTLHQAVQCGHLIRARQKLNAGADANDERDRQRLETPIEMAIWNDSVEMVELLLEYGADPNRQDPTHGGGNTALHAAVIKGSAKTVKVLLAHAADCDIQNGEGLSPIELAKRRNRTHLVSLMEAHVDRMLSITSNQSAVEQLYTPRKVAELLSVDEAFVSKLIVQKTLRHVKLDENTVRIPVGSVQRYLAKLIR
jgi:cytohesin